MSTGGSRRDGARTAKEFFWWSGGNRGRASMCAVRITGADVQNRGAAAAAARSPQAENGRGEAAPGLGGGGPETACDRRFLVRRCLRTPEGATTRAALSLPSVRSVRPARKPLHPEAVRYAVHGWTGGVYGASGVTRGEGPASGGGVWCGLRRCVTRGAAWATAYGPLVDRGVGSTVARSAPGPDRWSGRVCARASWFVRHHGLLLSVRGMTDL